MSTTDIRQRLHEYIRFADTKKIKAIYTIVEEEIWDNKDIWDKAFTNEMKRRSKELENGKAKGKSRASVSAKAKALLRK